MTGEEFATMNRIRERLPAGYELRKRPFGGLFEIVRVEVVRELPSGALGTLLQDLRDGKSPI